MDRAHDRYHPSWPAHARASFEGVIEAHGGWEAWDRLERVRFKLRLLRGFLVRIKGLGRTFHAPEAISVEPHRRRATFHFPDHDDVFDDGRLTLSLCTSPSPARGAPPPTVIDDGVRLFRGATFERWSPGHAAYFFGYAWVNYLSYPFLLPRLELAGWRERQRTFDVRFPEGFRTHCREQRFFFDDRGLLRRHDYRAPLAGPLVFGAHETDRYVSRHGIQIACRRRAWAGVGPFASPFLGILGELEP